MIKGLRLVAQRLARLTLDGVDTRGHGCGIFPEGCPMLTLFAAIALQAAPAPRAVPPPAPIPVGPTSEASDGRCLIAFATIGSNGTPEQQNAARLGALYFYGKLVGRNPRLDLVSLMKSSAAAVQASAQTEITRCGGELQSAGSAMQAAGNALQPK